MEQQSYVVGSKDGKRRRVWERSRTVTNSEGKVIFCAINPYTHDSVSVGHAVCDMEIEPGRLVVQVISTARIHHDG